MNSSYIPNIDSAYLAYFNQTNRKITIVVCAILLVALFVFSLWDLMFFGWEHHQTDDLLLWRNGISVPPILFLLYTCLNRTPSARIDQYMTLTMVAISFSTICMVVLMHQISYIPKLEGILVVVIGTLFLPNMFYHQKLLVTTFCIVSYVCVLVYFERGMQAYLHAGIYLSCIMAAGGIFSYAFDQQRFANFKKNKVLEAMAHTDHLTGAENRHEFEDRIQRLISRASKEGKSFALAILDIDFFKQYNDTYGHLKGDQCLIRIANSLLAQKHHPEDRCIRFGGEEFILIRYEVGASEAITWARSINQIIMDLHIPHEKSPFGVVTVCVGISIWHPDHQNDRTQLMSKADNALYRAKEHGRNQSFSDHDLKV